LRNELRECARGIGFRENGSLCNSLGLDKDFNALVAVLKNVIGFESYVVSTCC